MMFLMKSTVVFEADDIDDAFGKLSKHFEDLELGYESELFVDGELEIFPVIAEGEN